MVLEVLLFVSYHCCHNPCFHIDASNHCCRCWLSCCLEVAEVKLYYWHFACLLWVVVCSSFVGYACWTPIPKWKVCKLMFCSFLLCWLCWLGLLWIMTSTSCTSSLYEGALLKVCWASRWNVQCCFSFCCPIVVDPVPSCSWCWFDDCCPLWDQLCDIWPILCLLWYVECSSGLYVGSFPQMSFTDPVAFHCWKFLWPWNACCCVCVGLSSTDWLLLIAFCHLFWSLWLLLCVSSLLL